MRKFKLTHYRKFVKMGKGHKISFGLLEFYPDRVRKQRNGKPEETNDVNEQEETKIIIEPDENVQEDQEDIVSSDDIETTQELENG